MKLSFSLVFLLATFFVVPASGQDTGDGWKLSKSSDRIKAYYKKNDSSQLKRVKVETVVKASLKELVAAVKDAQNHHKWVFMNCQSEVIEESDDFNWVYSGVTDLPWPASDRDYITVVKMKQNPIDYSVEINALAAPDFIPQKEGFVRIRLIKSSWLFNPLGNGEVHIVFKMEVDPGGNIPIWLVNLAVTKGPYKTVEGLLKQVDSVKYSCSNIDYIKEFD